MNIREHALKSIYSGMPAEQLNSNQSVQGKSFVRQRIHPYVGGAPPLALLAPDDMGISVQVVGTGVVRTLVATLERQPMIMVDGTLVIVELSTIEELRDYLRGVTIEEAMATLALTNRSVVKMRKYTGVKGWVP